MVEPNDNDEKEKDLHTKFDEAIKTSVSNGEYVVKWVLVAELLNGEGDKGLWFGTSDDTTLWDVQGMLRFVSKKMDTKVEIVTWAAAQAENDDEDDE